MLVSLAIYSGEIPAALNQLLWINDLGGVRRHHLLLATTPAVDAEPLLKLARQGWGKVDHLRIPKEVTTWPEGNNNNFMAVAKSIDPLQRPFFFMESDVLPLKESWLDDLEAEYLSVGKPFMGDVHAMVANDGKVIPESDHMNGSGIYPARVLSYLPSIVWLNSVKRDVPWDVALRYEMLNQVDGAGGFKRGPDGQRVKICHPTQQICFCWKSYNYRIGEDGEWVCDTKPREMHRRINLEQHAVHHGCKDNSLLDLLRARHGGKAPVEPAKPVQRIAPAPAPAPEPEPPPKPAAVAPPPPAPEFPTTPTTAARLPLERLPAFAHHPKSRYKHLDTTRTQAPTQE